MSWVWILRYFIRFISIFICIVWRSPNKNTILHEGQKKVNFWCFEGFCDLFFFGFTHYRTVRQKMHRVHRCQYSVNFWHRNSLERVWPLVCGMCHTCQYNFVFRTTLVFLTLVGNLLHFWILLDWTKTQIVLFKLS